MASAHQHCHSDNDYLSATWHQASVSSGHKVGKPLNAGLMLENMLWTLYPFLAKTGSSHYPINICCVSSTLHTQHRQSHPIMSPLHTFACKCSFPLWRLWCLVPHMEYHFHMHACPSYTQPMSVHPHQCCLHTSSGHTYVCSWKWPILASSTMEEVQAFCPIDSTSSNANNVYTRYDSNGGCGMYVPT